MDKEGHPNPQPQRGFQPPQESEAAVHEPSGKRPLAAVALLADEHPRLARLRLLGEDCSVDAEHASSSPGLDPQVPVQY